MQWLPACAVSSPQGKLIGTTTDFFAVNTDIIPARSFTLHSQFGKSIQEYGVVHGLVVLTSEVHDGVQEREHGIPKVLVDTATAWETTG